jgi:hypothetical protein
MTVTIVVTFTIAFYVMWISKILYYEWMCKKDELEDSDHIYLRDSKGSILCAIAYCVYTHMHPTHETEVFNLAFIASLYIMVHVTYYMHH